MYYHPQTNKYFRRDSGGFTIDGNQYPAGWLNMSTQEDRDALGLVEVTTVGQREDDKYFWVSESLENGVITITNTPKSAEILEQMESAILQEKLKKLREVRESILNRLSGIVFVASINGDQALVDAYIAARQSLLDITNDLPTNLESAVQTITIRYVTLVQTALAAAPSLETAFNSIDI